MTAPEQPAQPEQQYNLCKILETLVADRDAKYHLYEVIQKDIGTINKLIDAIHEIKKQEC